MFFSYNDVNISCMMENAPYSSGLTKLWAAIRIQMISPKINKIFNIIL